MSTLTELVAKSAASLVKQTSPPIAGTASAKRNFKNLYETLNCLPNNGQGSKVAPIKWMNKGLPLTCYYEVTSAILKPNLTHGKARGIKYWKGKQVSEQPEEIRGGLKFHWHVIPDHAMPSRS